MKPGIRLKGFSNDWDETVLGAVCTSSHSAFTLGDIEPLQGKYPIFGASGYIKCIDSFEQSEKYIGIVKDGAGAGRAFICPAYSSLLSTMNYIIPKDSVDIDFLLNILNRIDFTEYITGSTIPHIYFKSYSSEVINLPSPKEQKEIGAFFSRLEKIISISTSRLASLKQMKIASLQCMFPQDGETIPKVRFNGFKKEWKKVLLNECLKVCKDKNYDNIYTKEDVLSVSDDYGICNQIKLLGRSYAGKSVANYGILKNGDIVYTKSPLKAKPFGIIKTNHGKTGIVSTLYAIYSPKEGTCSDYIEVYFDLAERLNKYIHPLVNKGAKNDMKVSSENALKGYIMIPSYDEQIKIAAYFALFDKLITLQSQRLEKLKQIKASCLDKMFV